MLDPYISDWLNLLVRWMHIVIGAAWIGTSFYFNWLNNNLRKPKDAPEEIGGELWSVHGGHFYQVRKFTVAPAQLPETLHWFKWESYLTWVTGITLLCIVYYFNASAFMVAPGSGLSPLASVGVGVGSIVGGWLIYDGMCRSPLRSHPRALAFLGAALVTAAAWGLTALINDRAAYIHIGAMLGTCMAGNVFFVIIPNQRKMVDAMLAGKEPDAADGRAGALRSLHNNYMTLPVMLIMISNHFPFTYGHKWNWAILAAISLIGAGVRHWFNLKGRGTVSTWLLPAAALATVALALVSAPQGTAEAEGSVGYAQVEPIVLSRCTPCHAAPPSHPAFAAPPKNLILETAPQIAAAADRIYSQAVATQTMPLGNLTGMTEEERGILGKWISDGAPLD